MTKYHINKKGIITICKAIKGNCPFGDNSETENHFDTLEEAQAFADKKNEEMYGLLTKDTSQIENLVITLGVEKTLDGFYESFSYKHLKELNEELINDYDLDDFIDKDVEEEQFKQIRRFLKDKALLRDLSERLNQYDLNKAIIYTKEKYTNYRK